MSEPAEKPSNDAGPEPESALRIAWQPFTFGGAAAFARSSWLRLLLAQLVVAALFGASVVWFLARCYAPVITQAIQKMPDGASVTNGQLTGLSDVQISETKFLSIAITSDDDAVMDQSSDLQIACRKSHVEISSLLSSALGSLEFDYGRHASLDLSRSSLQPVWGAWRPIFLAGAGIALVLILPLIWSVVAAIYAPAAKIVAWFCDRPLSWPSAWRLASAALLPGAVLLTVGVLLYGCQMVDIFGLGYFVTVHFLVSWVYVLISPAFSPRSTHTPPDRNPFTP